MLFVSLRYGDENSRLRRFVQSKRRAKISGRLITFPGMHSKVTSRHPPEILSFVLRFYGTHRLELLDLLLTVLTRFFFPQVYSQEALRF